MPNTFEPSDTVVARIQNRRGNRVNLPQPLEPGELGWCMDTQQLFIGTTEEDAIPGIEIYRGNVVGAEALAQDMMNQRMVEFDSNWTRVNNVVQLQQNSAVTTSEEELLAELREIPSSVFVDPSKRAIAEEIEINIEIIRELNDAVITSLGTFGSSALITYDWIAEEPSSAVLEVTGVTGGAIDTVSATDNGLGYISSTGTFTGLGVTGGTGTGATFNAIATSDSSLTSFTVNLVGSGYTVGDFLVVEAPTQSSVAAAASVDPGTQIGTGGEILQVTIDAPGLGYAGTPEVLFEDVTGSGATAEATIDIFGSIILINVTAGGTGYTAPTVIIQPPLSETLYKFRYDFGVEDQGTNPFVDPVTGDYANLTASIATLRANTTAGGYTSADAGILGIPPSPSNEPPGDFYAHGYTFSDGELFLDTARQASNVAAIINTLTASDTGVVNTKQNVEIITEYALNEIGVDQLIQMPINYSLPPTGAWPAVGSWNVVQGTNPNALQWDATESDIQFLDYSTSTANFNSAGKMNIASQAGTALSSLSDTNVEARDPGLEITRDIDFRSTIAGNIVTVEYRHNFAADVELNLTTKRWYSFT